MLFLDSGGLQKPKRHSRLILPFHEQEPGAAQRWAVGQILLRLHVWWRLVKINDYLNVNVRMLSRGRRLKCFSSLVPWGSYFDHALAWEKRYDDPKVMIVTYEELKQVRETQKKPHREVVYCIRCSAQHMVVDVECLSWWYQWWCHCIGPLTQNLPEEVKKISEFFGFPLTEEQVKSIAEQSTFRAMLETSNKSHGNLGSVFFRKGEEHTSLM